VLHERAVIADERHEQRGGRFEVVDGDHSAIDIRQVEVRRLGAKRQHRAGCASHVSSCISSLLIDFSRSHALPGNRELIELYQSGKPQLPVPLTQFTEIDRIKAAAASGL
jgi:hypothetical protein